MTSQKTALKFMTIIGLFGVLKIENLLFSENVVIEQSSSKCPGLSVHTVVQRPERTLSFVSLVSI